MADYDFRYRLQSVPEPRVNEARAAVLTGKVRSMMDLSDGLACDLDRMLEAAGVGVVGVTAGAATGADPIRATVRGQ